MQGVVPALKFSQLKLKLIQYIKHMEGNSNSGKEETETNKMTSNGLKVVVLGASGR
jgi:hypothetical protein